MLLLVSTMALQASYSCNRFKVNSYGFAADTGHKSNISTEGPIFTHLLSTNPNEVEFTGLKPRSRASSHFCPHLHRRCHIMMISLWIQQQLFMLP